MVVPLPLWFTPLFLYNCYSGFWELRELGRGGSLTIFALFHASLFLHLHMFITAMVVVNYLEFRCGCHSIFGDFKLLVPKFLVLMDLCLVIIPTPLVLVVEASFAKVICSFRCHSFLTGFTLVCVAISMVFLGALWPCIFSLLSRGSSGYQGSLYLGFFAFGPHFSHGCMGCQPTSAAFGGFLAL